MSFRSDVGKGGGGGVSRGGKGRPKKAGGRSGGRKTKFEVFSQTDVLSNLSEPSKLMAIEGDTTHANAIVEKFGSDSDDNPVLDMMTESAPLTSMSQGMQMSQASKRSKKSKQSMRRIRK